ncbi:hypothetical protein ACT4MK_12460 [Bradyrhizobium barranii]|uniref:hypothetical protein n=1 Tax=Bradyrhizobium barranii TaxID=2992140 RepID=UPI0040342419
MSGLQPDDAPQGQDKLVLAMLVHGQLHALRDHVTAEGGEGAWHGLGVEIPEIIGANMVVVEPEERHWAVIGPDAVACVRQYRPAIESFNADGANLDQF